ncbi:metal ABC transporter permease [Alkalibacillus aidingensis]|uniref:metal ABC transporter permease n=1 Tax=Alkalibacillus aidingensis TaxID=2747607 RepID=UPI0016607503|nr:metal ABC transporter permease [Alkalibacillus aidingensis]
MSYEMWIILTGSLVGVTCGTIGCLLIIRKMAMLSDGISHTVLLGIVLAYLISQSLSSIYMLIGALIIGMLTAFLVQFLYNRGIHTDASIGIVFTSLFALGVFLVSIYARQVHLDIDHVLMGEITFVPWNRLTLFGVDLGPQAVWMLGTVLVINTVILIIFYEPIKISSFDPVLATALGINVVFIHYLLMGMVSLSIVASFESVGSILVVTMLIVPGATAYLMTKRLSTMIAVSAMVGILGSVVGYAIAYWFDVSIAGAMSVALGLIFAIVFILQLIIKKMYQRSHRGKIHVT